MKYIANIKHKRFETACYIEKSLIYRRSEISFEVIKFTKIDAAL